MNEFRMVRKFAVNSIDAITWNQNYTDEYNKPSKFFSVMSN